MTQLSTQQWSGEHMKLRTMVLPQKNVSSAFINRRNRSKKKSFKRTAIFVFFLLITILYIFTNQRFSKFLPEKPNNGDGGTPDDGRNTNIFGRDRKITQSIEDASSEPKTTSGAPAIQGSSSIEEKVITSPLLDSNLNVDSDNPGDDKCTFRKYDPPRHYNLNPNGSLENQPPFLSEAKYIRGVLPIVINPGREGLKKVCIDTSEWETIDYEHGQRWPFSDGQNPSFISLKDDPYEIGDGSDIELTRRIDSHSLKVLGEIYGADELQDMYIGLVLFGDSQCRWNQTPVELREQGLSRLNKAPSLRSLVVIMDRDRNPVGSAVLKLVQDKIWGTSKRKNVPRKMRDRDSVDDSSCMNEGKENDGCFDRSIVQLDDARFFFHHNSLHVLFRNGPLFGYESQIQHPVHIAAKGDGKFEAYIKASEMFEVCCGRNIAFISEIPSSSGGGDDDNERHSKEEQENRNDINKNLLALTWVDPVTVEIVNIPTNESLKSVNRRRKSGKKDKSHIHGTNGYLLPLHTTSEVLGVAHFHRPEGRDKNEYARFGHHYTHAFFTLKRKGSDSKSQKFALNRLSNEFVFESPSSDISDGDIIQFASGIDLVGSDTEGKLLVSYGINDCESASFFLDMEYVQRLLHGVKDGDEVINLMEDVKA